MLAQRSACPGRTTVRSTRQTATLPRQIGFDVIFPIVVAELFAGPDVTQSEEPYTAPVNDDLAVGTTGMVDVASGVPARASINGQAAVDFKKIQ